MRAWAGLVVAMVVVPGGCGGVVDVEPESGGAGGQGGGIGGSGATGGVPTTTTTGGTGGNLSPVFTFEEASFSADCMPVIAPDPLQGDFVLLANGTGVPRSTSVSIVASSASFQGTPPGLYNFDVAPGAFTVAAGQMIPITIQKIAGSGSGALSVCAYCGAPGELSMTLSMNGTTTEVFAPITGLGCVR